MKNDYLNLVEFWNSAFAMNEEEKKQILSEIDPNSYENLAPSKKQFDVLTSFKDKKNVLDYGCGTGWASIIMTKSGAKKVTAVDVAQNSITMLDVYKEAYKVEDKIVAFQIDENWLSQEKEATRDGFFCSNVIDVVPIEMAKNIVKESARVTTKDALVVFSLNYYIDPQIMKERGHDVDGANIYINGVLRLLALTDEEWTTIFKQYYKDVSLIYYAWPGEAKEMRRLFLLKK